MIATEPGTALETPAHLSPEPFFPGTQMRFMQELIATFKSPPDHLKMPKKRGTFYARKPATGAPSEPDVIKLMRGMDLALQATPLGAHLRG